MSVAENDKVRVTEVQIPEEVDSTSVQTFNVDSTIGKKALVSSGIDACGTLLGTNGWLVNVEVVVSPLAGSAGTDSTRLSQEFCIENSVDVANVQTINVPTPGTAGNYVVTVNYFMGGSGEVIGSIQQNMTVRTQEAGTNLKGGKITYDNLLVPNTPMRPGEAFEIGVVSTNHASLIVNDPDGCSNSGTTCTGTVDGYCMFTQVLVSDQNPVSTHYCLNLPFTGTGSNTETTVVTGQTPDIEGEYDVNAFIETDASGEQTGLLETPITVTPSAPAPTDGKYTLSDDQLPGGGNDGDNIFEDAEGIAKLAVIGLGFWALANVADASKELAEENDGDEWELAEP